MLLTASVPFLLCNFAALNDSASAFSTLPPHAPTALLPTSLKEVRDDCFLRRHMRPITTKLHDISYSASSNGGWGVSNRDQSSLDGGDYADGTAGWDAPLPKGFTFADEEDYDDDDLNNGAWPNNNDHAICAPEVNKWTTLMVDGTNAAIHRPGK